MNCPYIHNDKCNRGCSGFECRHRSEAQPTRGMDVAEWQELFRLRERVRATDKDRLTVGATAAPWCARCGCGNDAARYAHLQGCPASLPDAAIDEAAHELQRVIAECGGEPTESAYDYLRAILSKLPTTVAKA
jgi:hypothetical protein